jgi:hypothetical protein
MVTTLVVISIEITMTGGAYVYIGTYVHNMTETYLKFIPR